jgi:hypothetical protein
MGSYCSLKFDDFHIIEAKSIVPDNLIALFQETDRVVTQVAREEGEEPEIQTTYRAKRDVILKRLALLGCTETAARERFSNWHNSEKIKWKEYLDEGNWEKETFDALVKFDLSIWRSFVPNVVATQYQDIEPSGEIERRMRDRDDGWLHFDGYGSLISIRALLDALPDVEEVVLDISDLINGGWIGKDEDICAIRRETDHAELRSLSPTVILAEGSSDIRILQYSLKALYPERHDYFSFFDHIELSVDGGANYLVKFLKAFAAARAPLRIIALFDNDTAGLQAYRQALALKLPRNIILLRLPDIQLASAYPTVGPQGRHVLNVNQRAASIELYLGRAALTDPSGQLRAVRWTGYVQQADAYQGEVEAKADVQANFLSTVVEIIDPKTAQAAYPELVAIWDEIFRSVEHSMAEFRIKEAAQFG